MELARNLKVESVCRLQPGNPLRVTPSQTVAEAVDLMRREHVGCVLICEGDRLIGLFTERDLLRRVLAAGRPLSTPIENVMTRQPRVVYLRDPIAVAVERMEQGGYRHLPVVDLAGRPVGVLSVKHIVHYLVEHFPGTIYNLPPDPGAFPRRAEGA
jgi:CBS domain-containing protein